MANPFKLNSGLILLSTEAPGGVYNGAQLAKIAAICASEKAIVKVTEDQRLALAVTPTQVKKVAEELRAVGLGLRHYQDGLHQPINCIGQACPESQQDAMTSSLDVAKALGQVALESPLKIGINGCARCCVPTHTLDLSVIGDAAGYRISLGGKNSQIPELATFMAEGVPADQLPTLLRKVVAIFKAEAQPGETLQELMERQGSKAFIEALAPYSQDAAHGDDLAPESEPEAPADPSTEVAEGATAGDGDSLDLTAAAGDEPGDLSLDDLGDPDGPSGPEVGPLDGGDLGEDPSIELHADDVDLGQETPPLPDAPEDLSLSEEALGGGDDRDVPLGDDLDLDSDAALAALPDDLPQESAVAAPADEFEADEAITLADHELPEPPDELPDLGSEDLVTMEEIDAPLAADAAPAAPASDEDLADLDISDLPEASPSDSFDVAEEREVEVATTPPPEPKPAAQAPAPAADPGAVSELDADEVGEDEANAFEEKLNASIEEEASFADAPDENSQEREATMALVESSESSGEAPLDVPLDDLGPELVPDEPIDDLAVSEDGAPLAAPTAAGAPSVASVSDGGGATPGFDVAGLDVGGDGRISVRFVSGASLVLDARVLTTPAPRELVLAGKRVLIRPGPHGGVEVEIDGIALQLPGRAA